MENSENEDEQIGFHKGCISTLAKERQELAKMVNVVEQLMQMHIKSLKDMGVELEEEAKKAQEEQEKKSKTKLDERI